jgi:hypothetical protein
MEQEGIRELNDSFDLHSPQSRAPGFGTTTRSSITLEKSNECRDAQHESAPQLIDLLEGGNVRGGLFASFMAVLGSSGNFGNRCASGAQASDRPLSLRVWRLQSLSSAFRVALP